MDLSRMTEFIHVVDSDLKFYAEIHKPTVKEFTSSGLPSQQTVLNFFTHYKIGEMIELTNKLKWRGDTYDVVEIAHDYARQEYSIIKVKKADVRSGKPFSVK